MNGSSGASMGGVWIIWRVKGPAVAHAHSLRAEASQSVSALIHRVSAVSACSMRLIVLAAANVPPSIGCAGDAVSTLE